MNLFDILGPVMVGPSSSHTAGAARIGLMARTLLGGEPFEPQNQPAIVELLRQVKRACPDKSIWAFSGYLFDKDITSWRLGPREVTEEYVSYLDVLVDGPFVEAKKNLSLRFRGSENQRLIDVPASLKQNEVVLWQDWQSQGKGLRK